ncbi:tumor necrosis factor a (TNF superfamily, member 2) [Misgurnus anguillicaudatus]|uniref:tumor necrosis factor a (TNF superfamily, member 2) n=1 Tax=Misgurnus anguillicaudatus TaxID=75329 RepID=UPI003CCF496D
MMDHDSEILLDIEDKEVSPRRNSSSKSGIWRICGALLAVALCAAAAVCFTFNKDQSGQGDERDLRHMLRAAPQQANITTKHAIHLTGVDIDGKSLEWKNDQDQAFSQGGLKLENNKIIIPEDGLFFVYSQASFHLTCTSNSVDPDDHEVHLSHAVMRYSDSYADDKPLFSAMRSACVQVPDSEMSWYNTIYLGAAFQLRAGDKLSTKTSNSFASRIDSGDGKTFFGAFAL